MKKFLILSLAALTLASVGAMAQGRRRSRHTEGSAMHAAAAALPCAGRGGFDSHAGGVHQPVDS